MTKTKSHLLLGIISIIFGLVTAFILTPLYGKVLEKQISIIRVKEVIKKGQKIKKEDIEKVNVFSYNLSENLVTDEKDVIDKYSKTDFYKNSYIVLDSLSDKPLKEDVYLDSIPKNKLAISITVQSFAAGLSSKLVKGDVVTVIAKPLATNESDNFVEEETEIIPSLRYVEVLSATKESGDDKEEIKSDEEKRGKLESVTLLVNEEQAKQLVSFENERSIHLALKCRDDENLKKELLKEQDNYFNIDNEKREEVK